MSTDPELADAPDTPADIAWEARHCADRLDSLAEIAWETVPEPNRGIAHRLLAQAARDARIGAAWIQGEQP